MSREKAAAVEGLVTSDAVQAGAKLRKQIVLILVGLVIVAVLVVGAWYVVTKTTWLRHNPTPAKTIDYSKLSPTAAIKQAQTELKAATTDKEKYSAYTNLGSAYTRNSQPEQAAGAYQQAADTIGNSSSGSSDSNAQIDEVNALGLVGASYLQAGQTAKAITVYDQVLELLHKSSDPKLTGQIPRYEEFVANLKAGN